MTLLGKLYKRNELSWHGTLGFSLLILPISSRVIEIIPAGVACYLVVMRTKATY